jgi:Zn-dependent metalloprotease
VDAAHVSEGPAGPTGGFLIAGELTPRTAPSLAPNAGVPARIAAARQLISEERELFGIEDVQQELVERATKTDEHDQTHITFDRLLGGLRLEGMEVFVHFDGAGNIVAVNGTLVPVPASMAAEVRRVALGPMRTREDALEAARREVGLTPDEMLRVTRAEAELVALAEKPHVAWVVRILNDPRASSWRLVIDARTGAVLRKKEEVFPTH